MDEKFYFPDLKLIRTAAPMLNKIRIPTSPMKNRNLSDCLEAYIFFTAVRFANSRFNLLVYFFRYSSALFRERAGDSVRYFV